MAHERTGQGLDEEVVRLGVVLGVRRARQSADVAGVLEQRMLEAAAGAEERDALLARVYAGEPSGAARALLEALSTRP